MKGDPYDMYDSGRILKAALVEHRPNAVIVLYSGGYDSMITAHVTQRWLASWPHTLLTRIVSIDTGISADGWRKFVGETASAWGQHEIWDNPNPNWFFEDAEQHGTPYTRPAHTIQFRNNKQRAIEQVLKHYKDSWRGRVMFVTGIRRAESRERANAPEYDRRKTAVWANPLVHWSEERCSEYRLKYELPINPFYDTVGGNGDCQCNWGGFTTLDALLKYSPILGARIKVLDKRVRAIHGWGWGERPAKYVLQQRAGQLSFLDKDANAVPNLCAGCERPAHANEARDFVAMQRMEWGDDE